MFLEALYCGFLIFIEALRYKNPYWIPSVVLSTFRIYLYIPLILFLILFLLDRKWRRHILVFVNLGMFLLFYGPQFIPKSATRGEGFSAMTFNVESAKRGVEPILEYITDDPPEILALQEIPKGSELLQELQNAGFSVRHRAYFEGTSRGMALAVRKPFVFNRVMRKTYHEGGRWSYLFAEIEKRGHSYKRFNVVLPHLLPFGLRGNPLENLELNIQKIRERTYWQIQETGALMQLVHDFMDPTIMLGDFNTTPEQRVHSEIRQYMDDVWLEKGFGYGGTRTYGVPLRIDYIYLSSHFDVHQVERGPVGLSDHRAVRARLVLNPPSGEYQALDPEQYMD